MRLWVFSDEVVKSMLADVSRYSKNATPADFDSPKHMSDVMSEVDAIYDQLSDEVAKRGGMWEVADGRMTWSRVQ